MLARTRAHVGGGRNPSPTADANPRARGGRAESVTDDPSEPRLVDCARHSRANRHARPRAVGRFRYCSSFQHNPAAGFRVQTVGGFCSPTGAHRRRMPTGQLSARSAPQLRRVDTVARRHKRAALVRRSRRGALPVPLWPCPTLTRIVCRKLIDSTGRAFCSPNSGSPATSPGSLPCSVSGNP
jgi:hypothetical protein